MDFHTLFITDLTSIIIYTVAVCALALANPKIRGLRWFAVYLVCDLASNLLTLLRGHPPIRLTNIVGVGIANEFNDFSFIAMYLGFHWFLRRSAKPNRLNFIIVATPMVLYGAIFPFVRGAYWLYPLIMLPVFTVCILSTYLCLRHATGTFRMAARGAASVFLLQCLVGGYRTVLITSNVYLGVHGFRMSLTDQRALVSKMILTVVDSLFTGCFLWFYVLEFQSILRQQARTDPLTGALNRRAFHDVADREISRAARHATPLALIVLDLDHFKQLNDTHGHAAGDAALRELVALLTAELRTQDLVARSGGEEFLALLPDTSLARAEEVAERLRCAIEKLSILIPAAGPNRSIAITASLGVAAFGSYEDTWQAMHDRADQAMYAAKQLGRNRVVVDNFGVPYGISNNEAIHAAGTTSAVLPAAPHPQH